jgi:hypothetical protein
MTSKHWKVLSEGIETLRNCLLPLTFDPTGTYAAPVEVQARTRAFVVLAHAEVETYLEGSARKIAKRAEGVWQKSKRITRPFAYVVSHFGETVRFPLAATKDIDPSVGFAAAFDSAFKKFYRSINDNHGIRETNVLSLFCPLGMPTNILGGSLLPELNSYGAHRGEYAHNSASVVQMLDPETEYEKAKKIVSELLPLDEWFVAWERAIR